MKRRRKRKMSSRAKAGAVLFAIIIALLAAAVISAEKAVKSVAVVHAEYYSRLTANKIVSSAVSEYLENNRYKYSDFAAVLYNEEGEAVSVEAVSYNINKLQSELMLYINNKFEKSEDTSAEIPLGSLTDSYLLAGKGPHIRLRICPAGDASVRLTSSFTSAGMNQTCHRISAVVTAEMNSSIPLYSFRTQTCFEFLIAENIIVGEVPESTLSVWSEDNLLSSTEKS